MYQPKIELSTMRVVGAEALVRAPSDTRNRIALLLFTDAPEEDLLKTELVILTALGDWDIFNENGMPLKFAVNVPVSAFTQAADLILEVTEDEMINDYRWPKTAGAICSPSRCPRAS